LGAGRRNTALYIGVEQVSFLTQESKSGMKQAVFLPHISLFILKKTETTSFIKTNFVSHNAISGGVEIKVYACF